MKPKRQTKTPSKAAAPSLAKGGSRRFRAWQLAQDMKERRANNPTIPEPDPEP